MAEKRKRRRFTAEFKAEAVKRLRGQRQGPAAGRDRARPQPRPAQGWRNEHLAAGSAEALARQKAEAGQLARLKREIKRLEQEIEILKKAAAFFAREGSPP